VSNLAHRDVERRIQSVCAPFARAVATFGRMSCAHNGADKSERGADECLRIGDLVGVLARSFDDQPEQAEFAEAR
jgi:hypothetical protein